MEHPCTLCGLTEAECQHYEGHTAKEILEAVETLMCQWPKIKQYLGHLPGTTKRGDDLYRLIFGTNQEG